MAINPEKKSGQTAVLQTRQENYDSIVSDNQKPDAAPTPLPELVKPTDTAMVGGNKVMVKDEDVNVTDVRVICPGNGNCTGWGKAKDSDAIVAAWNAANPV